MTLISQMNILRGRHLLNLQWLIRCPTLCEVSETDIWHSDSTTCVFYAALSFKSQMTKTFVTWPALSWLGDAPQVMSEKAQRQDFECVWRRTGLGPSQRARTWAHNNRLHSRGLMGSIAFWDLWRNVKKEKLRYGQANFVVLHVHIPHLEYLRKLVYQA